MGRREAAPVRRGGANVVELPHRHHLRRLGPRLVPLVHALVLGAPLARGQQRVDVLLPFRDGWQAVVDPSLQCRFLFRGEFFALVAGRHFVGGDSLPQRAVGDVASHNGRTRFPAREHRGNRSQIKTTLFA